MVEALLLSSFDVLSGKLDMFRQLVPESGGGWGKFHRHLEGGRLYYARENSA